MAPQGSNGFSWPNPAKVWKEVGLPTDLDALQWERKASGTDKPLRIPGDSYASMPESSDEADTAGARQHDNALRSATECRPDGARL